uniref:Uncharacterized protein n=1 Tax=Sipha flava TaxID=143950 RepID=A0A2S2RBH9_9HEMI
MESIDCKNSEEAVVIDDKMSSETSGGVNFIVGDEDGVDQASDQTTDLVNGDLMRALEEEKHENTDSFPLGKETRTGVTSNSNSYNNMFGLTEKRKRLRYFDVFLKLIFLS